MALSAPVRACRIIQLASLHRPGVSLRGRAPRELAQILVVDGRVAHVSGRPPDRDSSATTLQATADA